MVTLVVACTAVLVQAEDLHQTARDLRSRYADELEALAKWCDAAGLAEEARKTRAWLRPRDPNKLYVAVLPRKMGREELPDDAPADLVEWDSRLARLQRDQAADLYDLARRAIRAHRASLAFDLVLAALRENPDHEPIRRLLGYQPYGGQWHTLYEVRKLRAGQLWHERFGWILKSHVPRYEAGQRYYRGRWITAQQDAELHRDIQLGWDVETEHYTIRTNHSIEAAVQLSRELEQLYRVWKQLFARYYLTEAQVAALFTGRARGRPAPRTQHHVVYFKSREEYNQALRSAFPNIGISIGIYVEDTGHDRRGRAYFFAGEDVDFYHEATHQLFHESRPVAPAVGGKHNSWIVEGVALYMESLREEDGCHVLGGFEGERMLAARSRLLEDDFYVPLADFTAYGMDRLRHDERIRTLYSQAAGLTHFLIHYDEGRYRDALIDYLRAVYSGSDGPNTLPQVTGTSFADLDRQYREFMEQGPQSPAAAP
jgi:hypothetical protein